MPRTNLIERVVIKVITHDFAFVDIRLPGVMLKGMRATRRPDGSVILQPPVRTDGDGRSWPLYTLQPGVAEAALRSVRLRWNLANANGVRGEI